MRILVPTVSVIEKAAQDGLREAGRAVLKRARELSPTDEGGSDKSGFVRVDDLTLQVGFRSHISRMQHENLDYQHQPGEQAKFLEAAADEVDTGAIIAARVRAALG
ncbi:hypothetical protein [Cryobacterium sp. Y11]|uniref:hypothetical protein n=1 Tax=Cryobacterium sp. Y11 TaxID=2045016 RepID=UPI000CE3C58E|nr:hypothetical protein [Cryobacterium sp. Y11]